MPGRRSRPVEVEEVECVEERLRSDPLPAAAAEHPKERRVIRAALLVEHNRLAVQDRRARPESGGGRGDSGEPMRPVVTAPCDDPDAAGLDVDVEAIVVPLDIVGSLRGDRDLGLQRRQARLYPLRHGIAQQRRLPRRPVSGPRRASPVRVYSSLVRGRFAGFAIPP